MDRLRVTTGILKGRFKFQFNKELMMIMNSADVVDLLRIEGQLKPFTQTCMHSLNKLCTSAAAC